MTEGMTGGMTGGMTEVESAADLAFRQAMKEWGEELATRDLHQEVNTVLQQCQALRARAHHTDWSIRWP